MPKVEKYIARKRVRGTDFITGTDKDGNVVRFSGAFFISTIVNESNYLSLVLDEQEARIAADELLDDKIFVLGEHLGARISQNESGLTQLGADIHNELYGPGGITESYTSAITQTAHSISMSVDAKLYGPDGIEESYSSLIQQTASSITSSVDGKLYGPDGIEASYTSMIQQTANSITLSVDEKLYGPDGIEESYSSLIQQTAQSIVLSVESELYGPDGIQQKYTSALQLLSDQIILTVDGTLNDFENEVYTEVGSIIQQSATDILFQVDGKIVDVKGEITTEYISAISVSEGQILSTVGTQITGLDGRITSNTSSITQLSDSIDLSVFTNGVLDAGILIGKINDNTSGVRITGKSILLDGNVEITGTAFAENIYASGATLGGFTINETSLQLGTQAAWNPSSGTDGLLMGIDPLDSKYKFYLGDVENHLIWNGENLIISGFALIGDGTSTTTLNDLGKLEGYFEIVNEGQANEYLKLLAPLAVTGEVQAWASDPNVFPPNIWSSLPLASDTTLGAVRIGAGLSYNAVTGRISVDGSVGGGFDESANYSPSGIWDFTGSVSVGGSPVATQAYAQPTITGGASTITSSNLTASRALISNASGKVAVSAVTSTELGYLDGVTSAIQAQLNGKAALAGSSTQNFTVKDLYIHGTVNHWLADVITVDDARLQLNRSQGGATVASGLDIFNGMSVVSSLEYGTDGIWRAGGQRLYTDAYKPLADNATNLGGYSAASYPRKAENAVITGAWRFFSDTFDSHIKIQRGALFGSMTLLSAGGVLISGNDTPAGANSAVFKPDGSVGFGTITPTERLHVAGNGLFEGNNTLLRGRLRIRHGLSNNVMATLVRAHDNGNEGNAGNYATLLIHGGDKTSDSQPWNQVNIGNQYIGAAALAIKNTGNYSQSFHFLTSYGITASGENELNSVFSISTAGNIVASGGAALSGDFSVSGTSTLTGAVTAGGNITAAGEVTAYSSSDSRLKQNIKPITSALDIIEGLNPVSYNWNKKAIALNSIKDNIRTNYGVIAQEVEKVLPDLVHETNGYKSVDYPQLFGIMLAAIKELKQEINEFKN